MAQVGDVAAYIMQEKGRMTTMKLHKLLYYCQAWHVVWDEELLFDSKIEAWIDGPVIPEIYKLHRRIFILTNLPSSGNPDNLTESEQASVDGVLRVYGDLSARELADRTHREAPWVDARRGLDPNERSNAEISQHSMYQYYAARLGWT